MSKETEIAHRSFSQFTSLVRCGKAYQLERVLKVESAPALWFVGGSTFHAVVEQLLKETDRVRY